MSSATEKQKAFMQALKDVGAKFKQTPINLLPKIAETSVATISTGSLTLDSVIGGGVAKGRIVEIYGGEASGKTSVSLIAIAHEQERGGKAVFLDVEQAFDPRYAKALGVDIENLGFAQPVIAEDCMAMVKDLCASGAVDIIVLDSVASMVPKAEYLEDGFEKNNVALLARLMSKALRQIAGYAHKNGTTVIFLNQVRSNVGQLYGPQNTTPGGKALKFYASQRIEVKRKDKVEEDGEVIGNEVFFKCVKNKIAPPFGEGTTVLTYKKGINRAAELLVIGERLGTIIKEGRTYYYNLSKEEKKVDISGFGAKVENGRIKIGVNSKAVLRELENNKVLYELIAKKTIEILAVKNGLAEDVTGGKEDVKNPEMFTDFGDEDFDEDTLFDMGETESDDIVDTSNENEANNEE